MFRGIIGADVREGDVVRTTEGRIVHCVHLKENPDGAPFRWVTGGECLLLIGDETKIELLHRPWPEGKANDEMLAAIARCARRYVAAVSDAEAIAAGSPGAMHDHLENPDDVLVELRQAIEAYELGKPLK